MTMPQAAGKKEGMQSKFELNRTKAADLRSIGNFNQANVSNNHTGLLLSTLEYSDNTSRNTSGPFWHQSGGIFLPTKQNSIAKVCQRSRTIWYGKELPIEKTYSDYKLGKLLFCHK